MDISLDFARMLLEGDQLARADRLEQSLVVYRNLVILAGKDPAERMLADARIRRVQLALQQQGVQVVQRTSMDAAPSQQARAEAMANSGDFRGAAGIYEHLVATDPSNSLTVERLDELRAQLTPVEHPAATPPPPVPTPTPAAPLPPAPAPAPAAVVEQIAQAAQSVVQQAVTTGDWAKDLPQDPVEMLEEMLRRIRANRRSAA